MVLRKDSGSFTEESQTKPVEKSSNLQSKRAAETSVRVLYLTGDFVEADYLAFQLRKIATNMEVDVCPINAFDKLRSGGYDVALIDCCGSHTVRTSLVAYLKDDIRDVTVVVIIPDGWNGTSIGILKATADAFIFKGRNMVNELPMAINKGLSCYEARMSCRVHSIQGEIQVNGSQTSEQRTAGRLDPVEVVASNPRCPVLNKRNSRRLQVQLPSRLEWDGCYNSAVVRDLSESGIFLETSTPPQDGSKVIIHINTGNSELTLSAAVIHQGWFIIDFHNFYGFGARFTDLNSETIQRLIELLNGKHELSPPKTMLTP